MAEKNRFIPELTPLDGRLVPSASHESLHAPVIDAHTEQTHEEVRDVLEEKEYLEGEVLAINLEPSHGETLTGTLNLSFNPQTHILTISGNLEEKAKLHIAVAGGHGTIRQIDEHHLFVGGDVEELQVEWENEHHEVVSAGMLQTGEEAASLTLINSIEKAEHSEEELIEFLEAFESTLEGKEIAEEQAEALAEALEEIAELAKEAGHHGLHEHAHAAHDHFHSHKAHTHEEHSHQHHHEHEEHKEHEEEEAVEFNPEDRHLIVPEHKEGTVKVKVVEGQGEIKELPAHDGHKEFEIGKGVDKIEVVVEDKEGHVVLKAQVITNGKKFKAPLKHVGLAPKAPMLLGGDMQEEQYVSIDSVPLEDAMQTVPNGGIYVGKEDAQGVDVREKPLISDDVFAGAVVSLLSLKAYLQARRKKEEDESEDVAEAA